METQVILAYFVSARGIDNFWVPLLVAVLAGIILAVVDRNNTVRVHEDKSERELSTKQVREIIRDEISRLAAASSLSNSPVSKSHNKNDEDIVWLLFGGLVFLATFYARYQSLVLDYSVMAATSLAGFWLSAIIFTIVSGTLSGKGWALFIVSVCILSVLALPILYQALNPLYAPDGISSLQQIATESGLFGLFQKYGAEGFIFLLFQVTGFIVLYGAWLYILFTLVFMSSSALVIVESKGRPLWLWLSVKTSVFSYPIKGTVIVFALYVISFILISGLAYEWWRPG